MRYVHLNLETDRETFLAALADGKFIAPSDRAEKPILHLNNKGERIRVTCEYLGGASKDNGFLVGTFFSGKFKEKEGQRYLNGWIMTAPVYHAILLALFAFAIVRSVQLRGFTLLPICAAVFDVFLFRREFSKQRVIENCLIRAARG